MSKAVIIISIIILLAGMGVGAYFLFRKPAPVGPVKCPNGVSDCAQNQSCVDGVCQDPSTGGGCTTANCITPNTCVSGVCTAPAPACTCDSNNCASPNTCVSGVCTAPAPACVCNSSNCASPNTCISGVCTTPAPACSCDSSNCSSPNTCISGVCTAPVPACSCNSSNCASPNTCVGGVCTAPAPACSCNSSNCTSPNTCVNGVCTAPAPTNPYCTKPSDCPHNQICNAGTCTAPFLTSNVQCTYADGSVLTGLALSDIYSPHQLVNLVSGAYNKTGTNTGQFLNALPVGNDPNPAYCWTHPSQSVSSATVDGVAKTVVDIQSGQGAQFYDASQTIANYLAVLGST